MKSLGLQLPPLLPNLAQPEHWAIWLEYCEEFKSHLGLDSDTCDYLGCIGAELGVADFKLYGMEYYSTSFIPAVRNAWYMAATMPARWAKLECHDLVEPILDYGCGVGYTLRWLKEMGYDDLWGWDVPGVQSNIAMTVLSKYDIKWWDSRLDPARFGTILCINTLEHVPEPMETLKWLRSISDNVIANCDVGESGDHVASVGERMQVMEELVKAGEHIGKPVNAREEFK